MTRRKNILGVLLLTALALCSCDPRDGRADGRDSLEKNLSRVFKSKQETPPECVLSLVNQSQMLRLLDVSIICDNDVVLSACADSLGSSTEVIAQLKGKEKRKMTLMSANFPGETFSFSVPQSKFEKMFVKINFIMTSGHKFQDPESWSIRIDDEERAFF